jgi:CheY-like chemotaxis protein
MKSKSILIVEDNDLNRKFFENLIGQIWEFESALNGREAIEKLEKRDFDLILMDIQMPEIDGITALKRIREKNLSLSPIIAVTAFADESERDSFLSRGFDGFITKPIRPKEFILQIQKTINGEKQKVFTGPSPSDVEDLVLDKKIFDQLSKYNKPDTIQQIYRDFIEEADQLLPAIKSDYSDRLYEEVSKYCHIIKGNAGTLGINRVYMAAAKAEQESRKNQISSLEKSLVEMEKEIIRFGKYLSEETIFNP